MKSIVILAVALSFSSIAFAQSDIPSAKPGAQYGKKVKASKAVAANNLAQKVSPEVPFSGQIEGTVVEVCKKKGCFMKMARENGDPIMVKFTDYAFFMPQDIVGKKVVVQGTAKMKETSVERLQHFAEDAGKSKEEIAKITQPVQEIEITADGVLVVK
ncbi:DUF4920 domain-containing protein [Rufibacter latericius]|uniref:DUF4920 domain-containing protein n=1 Tax=Rufibacter latericius TaxID=2487040 RepID=A0A3M9MK47_9BACT|nr:DUF4920 domain-containing protein [Rufibacter latericius]RNI25028.1 DUF4920 domain-containing protein [Rufibacter latericius]